MDWKESFLSVEVERELSKSRQNQPERNDTTKKKGCGCMSILIALFVGIVIWRLILELISFFI